MNWKEHKVPYFVELRTCGRWSSLLSITLKWIIQLIYDIQGGLRKWNNPFWKCCQGILLRINIVGYKQALAHKIVHFFIVCDIFVWYPVDVIISAIFKIVTMFLYEPLYHLCVCWYNPFPAFKGPVNHAPFSHTTLSAPPWSLEILGTQENVIWRYLRHCAGCRT